MGNFRSLFVLIEILCIFWFKIIKVEGIIGGTDAVHGQFTHTVSVQLNDVHICGGAIIGGIHILTAAQCVIDEYDSFKKGKFSIVAGVVVLRGAVFENSKITREVEKIFVPKEFKHIKPDYSSYKYLDSGNIAVLRLKEYLDLENNFIKQLNLPQKSRAASRYNNMQALVFGFGIDSIFKLSQDSRKSVICPQCDKLKYAEAKIIRKNDCKPFIQEKVDETHLCAKITQRTTTDSEGTCEGDVGSPLVMDQNTIIGVLTTTEKFCRENVRPAIYTNVGLFIDFIYNAMIGDIRREGRRSASDIDYRIAYYTRTPEGIEELQEFYTFI